MSGSNWATIPDPAASLPSLQMCVLALKENVELLTGQRGPVSEYSVDQRVLDIKNTITNGPTSLTARITQIFEATLDTLNTSSLASEITEITAEVTNARSGQATLLARITQVDQARITGDTALATDITTVQANVDSISASGQVKLVATSAPSGASAAYSWELTAGSVTCGMTAIAKTGGGGAIAFTANEFGLVDSGTYTPVFSYSSGIFTFVAPVVIGNANIGSLVVGNSNIQNNAVSQVAGSSSGSTFCRVTMTCRTSQVAVLVSFQGNAGSSYSSATAIGQVQIYNNGVLQSAITNNFMFQTASLIQFLQTTHFIVLSVSIGVNTFDVNDTNGASLGGVFIQVIELSK